jgi:hypothetical protein
MDSDVKTKIKYFLERGQVAECLVFIELVKVTKSPRTPAQNKSLHLWLNLIEKEAENQGVTWDMLVRHTSQLRVTSEGLKSACKQLIKALWGYTSTTQLKKTGDLDIVIDHMTDWLSKEMEVPAFPCDEERQKENLAGYKTQAGQDIEGVEYPEFIKEVKF